MRDRLKNQHCETLKAIVSEQCEIGVEETVRRLYHRLAAGGHLQEVGPAMKEIRAGIREITQEIVTLAVDTLRHDKERQRCLVQTAAKDLTDHDPDVETVFVIRDVESGRYHLDGCMLTENLRWADRYETATDAAEDLWLAGGDQGSVELVEVTRREAEPYVLPTKAFLAQESARLKALSSKPPGNE